MLGLKTRFNSQTWSHGRFGATVITHAAMALSWGLADYVLCFAAYNNSSFGRHGSKQRPTFGESLREGGGPHAEAPHVGFTAPVAGAGMAAQRYFHKYKVDPDKLVEVPLAFRNHARLNPDAVMQKPLTREDYFASQYIVEPLRLLDCSIPVDGSVALILTTAERARDCAKPPVYLLGTQGLHAGANEFIFGQPGLGVNQAEEFDYKTSSDQLVYRMAGVTPADIDAFYTYDAFSPNVLWALERFGYCGAGEAADWVQNGRIGHGGELPVNTNGGFLSCGHFNAWYELFEMTRQLRGECGERQVPNAQLVQWGTPVGDSLILGKHVA
jgi:acetyl-CoA acetyltransferase